LARGLNLLSGMAAGFGGLDRAAGLDPFEFSGIPRIPLVWLPMGYGLSILGLSIFALAEDRPWSVVRARFAALVAVAGLALGFLALPELPAAGAPRLLVAGAFWIPLIEPLSIVLGPPRPWTPDRVGQVVGAGLRATLVFHALVGAATAFPQLSLFCGIGYVVSRVVARWIPPN
jgi:hypothetical protein